MFTQLCSAKKGSLWFTYVHLIPGQLHKPRAAAGSHSCDKDTPRGGIHSSRRAALALSGIANLSTKAA